MSDDKIGRYLYAFVIVAVVTWAVEKVSRRTAHILILLTVLMVVTTRRREFFAQLNAVLGKIRSIG